MENKLISEKEYAVIKQITSDGLSDQRKMAKNTGISLGLTNLIIKQLIGKGYVKAKQLNRRKIQYTLTPKGFSEQARRSYRFTLRTINTLKSMKQKIQEIIMAEYNKGRNEFVIYGNSELNDLLEITFHDINNPDIKVFKTQNGMEKLNLNNPFYLYTNDRGINHKHNHNGISVIDILSEIT